jgi:hypothetical protein
VTDFSANWARVRLHSRPQLWSEVGTVASSRPLHTAGREEPSLGEGMQPLEVDGCPTWPGGGGRRDLTKPWPSQCQLPSRKLA